MHIAVIGGGLTGMSAALRLAQGGARVSLLERDSSLGGVAGSFEVNGSKLEKFYHHIFTSDTAIEQLIYDLGLGARLEWKATTTSYYAGRIYRLAAPFDLITFRPLPLLDRIRFGFLVIQARLVRDWRSLEEQTARQWLTRMAGERVYRSVWAPMLRGKFGSYAEEVSAVWIWNKLKLRGGSRSKSMRESLGYLRGGFGLMVDALAEKLASLAVELTTSAPVVAIEAAPEGGFQVQVRDERRSFDQVLVTTAPALFADMAPWLPAAYLERLRSIRYLANVCVILNLSHSLSDVYWLNISDNTIPFVGLVEHTNLQHPEEYGGVHLVYLTRYAAPDDSYYAMDNDTLVAAYLPHLRRIFPQFRDEWVQRAYVWRERYAQPLIAPHYSEIKPPFATPAKGLWLCSMAQVYPEDRGMNYAVDYGQRVAREILREGGN
ncbi:MAG: NAD(P)/FAD-dependent oxidoreductase [Anaerolineae bacterium]